MTFKLTKENYFSSEASQKYMGSTQYKSFLECEAQAMAMISWEWKKEPTAEMLKGKYVHAWNEGRLSEFMGNADIFTELSTKNILAQIPDSDLKNIMDGNPDIFKDGAPKKGKKKEIILNCLEENRAKFETRGIKTEFKICNEIIQIILKDPYLSESLKGEKEKIFTAEMFGVPWKIMIDSYRPEKRRFTDLKTFASLYGNFWRREGDYNIRENVFEHFGAFRQMAIYAEIERLANGRAKGDYFSPHIAVVTKEKYPDRAVIGFDSPDMPFADFMTTELYTISTKIERIKDVKSGKVKPARCEVCDYCRATKVLTGVSLYSDFNLI